ncbi:MAG: Rab family GTPase [Candidatus Thorarchaeota archaeon]
MSRIYKTVLVGEGGVGKTSIAVRYTEDRFDQQMKMTIGVNFATKKVQFDDIEMTLMIWDLGGQPRFQDVIVDYYRGSRIAIAVYDVNRTFTLHRLSNWIDKIRDSVLNCPIVLVGNKMDERTNGHGMTLEDAQEFASQYNGKVFEVSAKSGVGMEGLFQDVAGFLAGLNK